MSLELARRLDAADPLASFRDRFVVDDPTLIYLDGNSLGRLPKATAERVRDTVERQWGSRLIRSWGEAEWVSLPQRLGAKVAGLLGARADEVLVCDSTSVNFYKLVRAALALDPTRRRVVTDAANFPSDLYLLQGIEGLTITRVPSEGVVTPPETIEAALADDVALLTLSHVSFKSGQLHDMARLTDSAHRVGARVLWDLSHSVGAVPLALSECQADMAVGCGYKYLNGGPGSPAFLYVRHDLQDRLVSPIQGWFGQRDAFDFSLEYQPATGISRFLAGTPPVLAMVALEPGVDLLMEAGMSALREKSIRQTELLIQLWEEELAPLGVTLNSPREALGRGSHVSLGHPEAWRINQALIQTESVIPDFRAPDTIRFGITPLYTSFEEVAEAMSRLRRVIQTRSYERFSESRAAVT